MAKKLTIFLAILLLLLRTAPVDAQSTATSSLEIGNQAPPLLVREWVKGTPVKQFEKGYTYVIEFWATWCGPCKAAMPRLSKLARKYRHKTVFIGMDVLEEEPREPRRRTAPQIKAFIDSMGDKMRYTVALQDSNFMEKYWLTAAGVYGIPTTFIVNADGRIAWIGHPAELHKILPKVIAGNWDIQQALSKRNADHYLENLDDSLRMEFNRFYINNKGNQFFLADSALRYIAEIIQWEPQLKYASNITYQTFSALLINDPAKAYEYGRAAIETATYDYHPYREIIEVINRYADNRTITPEIYGLGAAAYQGMISETAYPEMVDMFRYYNKMAEWYERANNKSKALDAQKKAIKVLKKKKYGPTV